MLEKPATKLLSNQPIKSPLDTAIIEPPTAPSKRSQTYTLQTLSAAAAVLVAQLEQSGNDANGASAPSHSPGATSNSDNGHGANVFNGVRSDTGGESSETDISGPVKPPGSRLNLRA